MPAQRAGRYGKPPQHAAILLTVSLLLPSTAGAQAPASPFDTIAASLRLTANVNHNVFHRYWSSDPGVELELETPFYFGDAEAGFHFNSFDGRTEEQPDFASVYVFVGWGYELPVYGRLDWRNGIRIGTFFTHFAGSGDNLSELELATALDTRLSYPFALHWSAELSTRYQVVFTHERLRLLFLAFGFSYAFKTPNWLQEFLR
jgi:hypothetical protein